MKRICNKRAFVTALVTTVLAAACFAAAFVQRQLRFALGGLLLLVWSASAFYSAFHKETLENTDVQADERDRYIAMKSSKGALQIVNGLLGTGGFVCIVLSSVLQNNILLAIGATLCAVLVVLFFILLACNIYYEKRN